VEGAQIVGLSVRVIEDGAARVEQQGDLGSLSTNARLSGLIDGRCAYENGIMMGGRIA